MSKILEKYAQLLVKYCLNIQPGEKLLIRTSYLAEPLIQKVQAEALRAGAYVDYQIRFKDQLKCVYKNAPDEVLDIASPLYAYAVDHFDAILTIMAPFDLKETEGVDSEKKKRHQQCIAPIRKKLMERSTKGELRWCLCAYPTLADAEEAKMTHEALETFIYEACMLHKEDPIQEWHKLGDNQQRYIDYLNKCSTIQFKGPGTDIHFSTKARTWINSDGKRNMPSGEVFTSPVEDSVNGKIYFSCPTVYDSEDVEGVTLTVKDGIIQTWHADIGQGVLDRVFDIPGARQFGEAAIGTNYDIQTITKNILFDEKIGGTIHMAIGASYPECGGKNESAVHWDMITDMTEGEVFADDTLIYKDGKFLI